MNATTKPTPFEILGRSFAAVMEIDAEQNRIDDEIKAPFEKRVAEIDAAYYAGDTSSNEGNMKWTRERMAVQKGMYLAVAASRREREAGIEAAKAAASDRYREEMRANGYEVE